MRYGATLALLAVTLFIGCAHQIRSGPLIDRYKAAECIPVTLGPTRHSNYDLKTGEGTAVHIFGSQLPEEKIHVKYGSTGKETIAALAGDYIYPADVGFDRSSGRLYVKAAGQSIPFGGYQAWLFEYDVNKQKQTGRVRVEPTVLPQECPANSAK
jgi:hypothetical protein